MAANSAKGLVALLRLPYWLMTGGLALLTALAITKFDSMNLVTAGLAFFSIAFIASGGFAINDYYDKESDAVIKPKRPIPSGALSLRQVVMVSAVFFVGGMALALFINLLSLLILAADSVLLLLYSALVKRKSGFAANVLMGVLTGTAFLYGQAVTLGANAVSPFSLNLLPLSLYPIALGTIGGNILRDVLSSEGDAKVGYPTLPQSVGNKNTIAIAAVFFALTAVLGPLPYLLGYFSLYYLAPVLIWGALLLYSAIRLVTSDPTVENVKKYERIITMSMMLLILSLVLEAFVE